MKRMKTIFFILISLLAYGIEPTSDSNEFKLGDKVQLKIQGKTEEELKEIFKEVESKNISKVENGLKIDFRNWKLGEKKYIFGKDFLKLNVKSNLKEDEKELFLNYSDGTATKKTFPRIPYIFLVGVGALIYSILLLVKRDKKEIYISPEEKFSERIKNLDEENYSYEISYALREYIDSVYNSNFLNGDYKKVGKLYKEDIEFIKKLDYIKFSGKSHEKLEMIKEKALEIYKNIKEVEKND